MPQRAGPAGVLIRPLRSPEAALFREIRLEGLRLHPDAFTSSYEEEAALTEADFAARIPDTPPDVILGAFTGDAGERLAIVGVVGFHAGTRLKQRHRAAAELPPDLAHPIDSEVLLPDPPDLRPKPGIPLRAGRETIRNDPAPGVLVIGRWGDRQNPADRLDPMDLAMRVNERDHVLDRRSSSAAAK